MAGIGQRLHRHAPLQHGGRRVALRRQLHIKHRAAHTGGGHGGDDFKLPLCVRLAGNLDFNAPALHLQHRLQAARTATAAQLAQCQLRGRLHVHGAAIGQLDCNKRIRRQRKAVAFLQGHAACRRGRGAAALHVGIAMHIVHRRCGRAQQLTGNFQYRAGLQPVGAGNAVVALQSRP